MKRTIFYAKVSKNLVKKIQIWNNFIGSSE